MEYPDVRRARKEDQTMIGELWMRLLREQETFDDRFIVADDALKRWENDFPMWLDDETSRLYVAEQQREILGFATARRWSPPPIYEESSEVYLDELYVLPEARRQGLGTQLLNAVRDWTDRVGARRIRLRVLAANEVGRAFWTSQEAVPLTTTLTIEQQNQDESSEKGDERSEKIGF